MKMNMINSIKHRITSDSILSRFCLASLIWIIVGGFSTNVWAQTRSYTVTVGVGVGKGTVYAELWKAPAGGDSKVSSTVSVSEGGGTKSKTDGIYWLTNAFGKYYATAATGYSFVSWHENDATCTNSAAGTTSPWSTGKKNQSGGYTFVYYAKFTPISYAVTLAKNDGSDASQAVTATYDAEMPSTLSAGGAIVAPTRTNYTFLGYFDAAEGGTKYYNADLSNAHIWDKASTSTLYAHWAPNYEVAFDKNGGQGDNMANQSFYYGEAAKALSTNTYTRAYTVAYTASDGATCSTSPANTASSYTFDGWATTADGSKAYADGAEVSDLTSTAGATVTLFARWINGGVTLPTATKKDSVLEGWYSNSARTSTYWIGAAGATYYPTADIRLYAKWIKKHTPVFTGPVYVGDYYEMDVDDTYSGFTFTHVSDSVAVITGEEGVISYDKATNTLTANKAGTATIKFTQIENDTLLGGTSDIWSIRVSLVTNNLVLNSSSDTKFVGQEVTNVRDLESQNSNATVQTSSSAPGIAHYDVANNKIVIDNAGDSLFVSKSVTITIWQAATAKYAASGNKTFTLTVNKYSPLFSGSNYNGMKVDDEQTADYTYTNVSADAPTNDDDDDFYYTIENVSFDSVELNKKYNSLDSLVRFDPATKKITALNAGECDIVFHQKETRSIYSGTSASYHITVGKWGNTLYANSSASYSTSTYVDRTLDSVVLTATNTDYANWPISVTQTSAKNDTVSSGYNETTRKVGISTHQYLTTATWAIHQNENYKYLAGDNTFSVSVIRETEATNCLVLNDATGANWGTGGEKSYTFSEAGTKLRYEIRRTTILGVSGNSGWYVRYSADGSSWKEKKLSTPDVDNWYADSVNLDADTRYVKFISLAGTGENERATGNHWVRSVTVARRTWMHGSTDTLRITKTAGNNPVYPNDVAGAGSFDVQYSIANGGDLKIVNDNSSKFTLSKTSFTASNCSADSVTINVTYAPTAEGRDTARLVIYNDVYRDTVLVTGVCVKRNQAGKWKENISTLRKDTRVIKPFSSTQSGSYGVTYISSDSTKVDISGDTIIAKAEGSATIYAEVRGDENYYPIRESIDITVTTDHVQYIVWNQDRELRRLKTTDGTFTLNAYATSDIDTCITNGPDAEHPRPITYRVPEEYKDSIITVSGNELTIVGAGKAKVIATQAGGAEENGDGHTYVPVSMTMDVVVRDPSAPCETSYLFNMNVTATDGRDGTLGGESAKFYDAKKDITYETSTFTSEPGYVTLFYKTHDGGSGNMYIDQYLPGTGWVQKKDIGTPPDGDTYDWTPDTIAIDRTAQKARVRIKYKAGKFYYGGLKVDLARYIEVVENDAVTDTLEFTSFIGTPQEKDVKVRWSDSRGDIFLSLPEGAPFTLSSEDLTADCNGIDTTDLRITFSTIVGQTDSCYNLVLSDGVTTKTIVLKATATAETVTFGDDGDWTEDDGNWSKVPNENTIATISDSVNVVISTEVEVYSLIVEEGATVTVTPTGGLTIGAGGIIGAAKDSIKIQVSTDGGTKGESGYVRISPEYKGEMPQATIETYTKGFMNTSTGTVTWQYLGSPIAGDTAASKVFGDKTFIYTWDESKGKWVNRKSKMKLEPFKGYAVSQSVDGDGKKITYDGQLVDMRDSVVIELQYTPGSKAAGCNVLANSFAAPIDISRLTAADFSEGVEATINLFNTGSQSDIENCIKAGSVNVAAAGQYLSIPVNNAKRMYSMDSYPIVIPPMQGFYVNTNKAGTLTLNYERLVWNADYEKYGNQPLRAKRRTAKAEEEEDEEDDLSGTLKVTLLTESGVDHMYILESPTNVPEYENGYDARKLMSGNLNIFAVEEEEQLAIDATNSLIGTKIGVRTGNDSEFKMAFSKVNSESNLSLLDKEMSTEISIYEGMEYTFYAVPNETITDRFEIVDRFNSPAITTGNDGVGADVNVQKFIKDNSLYIYKDGALYNALGERVR